MGRSICEALARAGNPVAVLDVNEDGAEQLAAELRSRGAEAVACRADVSDRAEVDRAMEAARGLGPIQILVTCAGIARFDRFREITAESWERIMAVNVTGTFNCVQSAISDMIEHHWGRVVLISSASAQRGAPKMAHYSASKGAIMALSKSLALEFASSGITVNNISPASIHTPMVDQWRETGSVASEETMARVIPVGRMGSSEDIAAAAMFICSKEAGYFTGQTVSVNGGLYLT
jgi:2-hydroxycyclohexanecarboxyl-CoA dehydrogenase